jgi:hypothetical protein
MAKKILDAILAIALLLTFAGFGLYLIKSQEIVIQVHPGCPPGTLTFTSAK